MIVSIVDDITGACDVLASIEICREWKIVTRFELVAKEKNEINRGAAQKTETEIWVISVHVPRHKDYRFRFTALSGKMAAGKFSIIFVVVVAIQWVGNGCEPSKCKYAVDRCLIEAHETDAII